MYSSGPRCSSFSCLSVIDLPCLSELFKARYCSRLSGFARPHWIYSCRHLWGASFGISTKGSFRKEDDYFTIRDFSFQYFLMVRLIVGNYVTKHSKREWPIFLLGLGSLRPTSQLTAVRMELWNSELPSSLSNLYQVERALVNSFIANSFVRKFSLSEYYPIWDEIENENGIHFQLARDKGRILRFEVTKTRRKKKKARKVKPLWRRTQQT